MSKVILKLSELPDDLEVSFYYSHNTYTVKQLKNRITELGEPHHETRNWAVIDRRKWRPSASTMLGSYIENEAEELYEDADDMMNDAISKDHIARIQAILDDALPDGLDYWMYGKDVEIDIFPSTEPVEASHEE